MGFSHSPMPGPWGFRLWVLQRLTGLGLVVLLVLHVVWLHYVDPASVMQVAGVELRLQALLFGVTDTLLLGIVVFHGMNGLRAILYDYVGSPRRRRMGSALLLGVGGLLLAYGLWAFLPFVLDLP